MDKGKRPGKLCVKVSHILGPLPPIFAAPSYCEFSIELAIEIKTKKMKILYFFVADSTFFNCVMSSNIFDI